MYSTPDFKKGLKIEMNGEPFIIVEFQHVKPGKGGAFVRTKFKNVLTGRLIISQGAHGNYHIRALPFTGIYYFPDFILVKHPHLSRMKPKRLSLQNKSHD